MSAYEQLLKDLGNKMGMQLRPDANQSCRLQMGEIFVQIDLDRDGEDLLLGSHLGTLPPGTYRDQIFQAALQVNGLTHTSRGVFAFSKKNDALVLFQFLSIPSLEGEKLFVALTLFAEHAKIWVDALGRGEIPRLEEHGTEQPRPFGL